MMNILSSETGCTRLWATWSGYRCLSSSQGVGRDILSKSDDLWNALHPYCLVFLYALTISCHPSFFSVSLACLKPTVFNCVCGCTIFLVPAIILSLQGSSEAVASVHQQHMHSSWAGLSVRELMRWFLAGSLWDVAGCSRNLRVAELSAACSAELHLPCRTTLSWLGEYGKGMGSCWGGLC